MEAIEEEDDQVRPGDRHSRKICRRRESAEVVFAVGGKASSPNTPAEVKGSKSEKAEAM